MLSRSNIFTLLYVALGTILVQAFLFTYGKWKIAPSDAITFLGAGIDVADALTAGILVVAGILAVLLGAELPIVLVTGSLGVFFALTVTQVYLVRYLALGAVLFCLGIYGMVASRNAVRVLMSIELMLNAVNINLVAFAHYVDSPLLRGQIFTIFVLTIAAAEAAVGLAIVLAIYRNMATVDMNKFTLLKW